jgi:enolase-phosphatase E1
MDGDRKSTALKEVQGLIWDEGYEQSALHGVCFPDVPVALRRWRAQGVRAAIYSSGSERAQRRLFATLPEGDVTPLLDGFFDTRVGPKREPASYQRIADALGHDPGTVLFVSDMAAELDAATRARLQAALCLRPGNAPQPSSAYDTITAFDEIV